MQTARAALALLIPLSLGACAVAPPTGPSVLALPAKGKDMQTFQAEDYNCRNYAQAQIGGNTPANAANQSAVGSAALGTALGAGAGALLGRSAGPWARVRRSAPAPGCWPARRSARAMRRFRARSLQQRYDMAYTQCIASTGNSVQAAPGPAMVMAMPGRRPMPIRPRPTPIPIRMPTPTRISGRASRSASHRGWSGQAGTGGAGRRAAAIRA